MMMRRAWLVTYLALAALGVVGGFQLSRRLDPPRAPASPVAATPALAPSGPSAPLAPSPPPASSLRDPVVAAPGPSFVQLVKEMGPAVVHIQVRVGGGPSSLFGIGEGWREGQGTGFLVSSDGYILTNDHVVGSAERIKVRL